MKIFIDVSPGFYKTKLFNELNKHIELLVVYTSAYDASSRNADFLDESIHFPYVNLRGNHLTQCFALLRILLCGRYEEIIVGGYDSIYCWLTVLLCRRSKCSLMIESTYRESPTKGWRALMKRLFMRRLNIVYAPGPPHEKLARQLGFRRTVKYWHSVGLFNTVPQPTYEERPSVTKFLFVGRLIPVKNLPWLVNIFIRHPELELTIVGFGEQEKELRKMAATSNIHIVGAVNNKDLPAYYQAADVFVLPSKTETWGLVVEEALNNGTPVMLSDMVGCADTMVVGKQTGVTFAVDDEADFERKLEYICNVGNYNNIRKKITELDFPNHEKSVVAAFYQ